VSLPAAWKDSVVLGDDEDGRIFEALRRESGLIAQHLGIGATALGRADFERTARYAEAFFALTVGFERGCKLVLTLDAAVSSGRFLDARVLRGYGHDLVRLLARVEEISRARGYDVVAPKSDIHEAILAVLATFATNVTRYFNLEVLGAGRSTAADPITTWYLTVSLPVLAKHQTAEHRRRAEARIQQVAIPASSMVSVVGVSETGEPIRNLQDLMRRQSDATFARAWERTYVLQLARFMTDIIGRIGARHRSRGFPFHSWTSTSSLFKPTIATSENGKSGCWTDSCPAVRTTCRRTPPPWRAPRDGAARSTERIGSGTIASVNRSRPTSAIPLARGCRRMQR
jgi:hypothetical protein